MQRQYGKRTIHDWTTLSDSLGIGDGVSVLVLFNGMELEYTYNASSSNTVNSTASGPGTIVNGKAGRGAGFYNILDQLILSGLEQFLMLEQLIMHAAIQAASNAAMSAGDGNTLLIPEGTFNFTSTITITPQKQQDLFNDAFVHNIKCNGILVYDGTLTNLQSLLVMVPNKHTAQILSFEYMLIR